MMIKPHSIVGSAVLLVLLAPVAIVADAGGAASCEFCGTPTGGAAPVFYDMSSLPDMTFQVDDSRGIRYFATSPCSTVSPPLMTCCGGAPRSAAVQEYGSSCLDLGTLANNSTVTLLGSDGTGGFNVTLPRQDGTPEPQCNGVRTSLYNFVCDPSAPASGGPTAVAEDPGCNYVFTWPHPAACGKAQPGRACSSPAPPAPQPPAPGNSTCTPQWKPTWDMRRSTILYACNASGLHSVEQAVQYGVVVYDWSNGKAIWANQQPMNDEELLTKQAEMVQAADPGVPGEQPRVWVYRNTIKALNWYTSVREKLDDPAYSGWFVRFKDYTGPASNNSYHVPACTYEKCSGFYHDQEQTPEYPHGDGSCESECDCGKAPCGEYIFDFRNDTILDWYINEYMVTNETLLHTPIPIGLGWLDDSMKITGPTEEDKHFIEDTGSTPQYMQDMVTAYDNAIDALRAKVVPMGGWWWQLIRGRGPQVKEMGVDQAAQCATSLRSYCTENPSSWDETSLYQVQPTDAIANATQYTAEFLLSRGPYAWLGYSWLGCGGTNWPRPQQWDVDYGTPSGVCAETGADTKIFRRTYSKATVEWNCNTATGSIEQ